MELSEIFKGGFTEKKWRELGEYLGKPAISGGPGVRVRTIGGKTIVSTNRRGGNGILAAVPFDVTVSQNEKKQWEATSTRGVVAERVITEEADTMIYHVPSGMLKDDGTSIPIPISSGQGLFVIVEVGPDGKIADAGVKIAAENAEDVSVTHFKPEVGDEYGEAGTYKYRLGKFTVDGDAGTFAPDMAGSHISHWVDLPAFVKEAGDNDIFKKYDRAEKQYKTKGLSEWLRDYKHASKTIHIDDTGDELRFETWGQNLDIKVYQFFMNTDGNLEEETAPAEVLCLREGIFLGSFSDSDLPGSYGEVVSCRVSRLRGS